MRQREWMLVASVVAVMGCVVRGGDGAQSAPLARFPSQGVLDRLAASRGAGAAWPLTDHIVDLSDWAPEHESPRTIGSEIVPAPSVEGVAWPALDAARVTYTLAAKCAAHEVARIVAAHDARPSPRVSSIVQGRCGLAAANVSLAGQWGSAGVPDAQLLAPLGEAVERAVAQIPLDRRVSVGIGVVHGAERSAAIAVLAEQIVELAPFAPVPQGDTIVVRGRVLAHGGVVGAVVTSGAYRVVTCDALPSRPPEFAVRCPIARGDESAWMQVQIARSGRLIADHAATILVRRIPASGGPGPLPPAARVSTAAPPAAGDPRAALDLVNGVRALGRLRPLRLSVPQSEELTRLTEPFFRAMQSRDAAAIDTLALGALAGYRVADGPIRRADIVSGWCAPMRDLREWLDWALMLPVSRKPLLDPFAQVLAFGHVVGPEELGGIAGIATTYRLYDVRDRDVDRARVIRRLHRARRALGRRTRFIRDVGALDDAADGVREGRLTPADATRAAADDVSQALGANTRVHVIETLDLDSFPFPSELLGSERLSVAVEVTYHRPPGAAWGQHVVMLVALR